MYPANQTSGKRERDERIDSWECGPTIKPLDQRDVRERVLKLSKEVYWDFNYAYFKGQIKERERMVLSWETATKLRLDAGTLPKRRRKGKKHRKHREWMVQGGAMVIWDGSDHPWFGSEHPSCCLIVAMDDAMGTLLAARFFPFEGASGYLWLL